MKETTKQAREIQDRLQKRIRTVWSSRSLRIIAAADVAFPGKTRARAALVVLTYPALSVLETVVRTGPVSFPYIPGLLSFREIPMLVEAFGALKSRPDCILCDGQGIAHPRRMGLAAHLGLLLDCPAIGCAKSRLFGTYEDPPLTRGAYSLLLDPAGQAIGAVLRTREAVKPIFVSPGHRMSLEKALEIVLECSPKYRIPEPIRLAHKLAGGGTGR